MEQQQHRYGTNQTSYKQITRKYQDDNIGRVIQQ